MSFSGPASLAAGLLVVATALGAFVQPPVRRPFPSGERAVYAVKYLFFPDGVAVLNVAGVDTVRGHDTWHFMFTMNAGMPGFRLRDTLESWVDTATFQALRVRKEMHDGGADRVRRFEIFPDRATYVDRAGKDHPSSANPLDDIGFLYFVRTLPLENSRTYSFDNYFEPETNPVTFKVVRRELLTVPAGRFKTVVVEPVIRTTTMFSEGGQALVWFTDDSAHVIVQIKTKMKALMGTLTFQLTSYQPTLIPAPGAPAHP